MNWELIHQYSYSGNASEILTKNIPENKYEERSTLVAPVINAVLTKSLLYEGEGADSVCSILEHFLRSAKIDY